MAAIVPVVAQIDANISYRPLAFFGMGFLPGCAWRRHFDAQMPRQRMVCCENVTDTAEKQEKAGVSFENIWCLPFVLVK